MTEPLQCTAYMIMWAPWLVKAEPYPNAIDWKAWAKQKGLPTGDRPEVGSVVQFTPGGPCEYSSVGHVAGVVAVYPNGSFSVTEADFPYGAGPHTGRIIPAGQNVAGFIYSPEPIPTPGELGVPCNFNTRVSVAVANVRSGPGTNYPTIGGTGGHPCPLHRGFELGIVRYIYAENISGNTRWYAINSGGWISGAVVQQQAPGTHS